MIPVSIVTGFLGAGKTTLIAQVIRDLGFSRTAVIVNELGEIGLDHDLVASGDESFVALTTGCLCCAMRNDIAETLMDLREKAAGQYDRVLIETSGLADPAPILHALMTDRRVHETHVIDTILTLIDPVHGADTLTRFPEARRQVALADRLMFSKADIAAPSGDLRAAVAALNPVAPDARAPLFSGGDPMARAARLAALPPALAPSPFARHADGIETLSLRRARHLPALALTLWLQAMVEHCGDRLLRMKGLVALAEMPDQPALVHGVRHVFSPPEFLERWPSEDRETRLVLIFQDIPRHFPARLMDAIEEEVREEMASRASG